MMVCCCCFIFVSLYALQCVCVISFLSFQPINEVVFVVKDPIKESIATQWIWLFGRKSIRSEWKNFAIVYAQSANPMQTHTYALKVSFNLIECESSNNPHSVHISKEMRDEWKKAKQTEYYFPTFITPNSMKSQWPVYVHFLPVIYLKGKTKIHEKNISLLIYYTKR